MKTNQISESIELGILMAISGGIMDAYSYLFRGQVFANAQTGNILLFGVSLSEGNFSQAMQYACPILAFSIGIMLADFARIRLKKCYTGGSMRYLWKPLFCSLSVSFRPDIIY